MSTGYCVIFIPLTMQRFALKLCVCLHITQMILRIVNMFIANITPSTISVITTYRCTAACEDCCFECSPSIDKTLTYEEIREFIISASQCYPSIRLIVFTGGECFILKEKLFSLIAMCTEMGFITRCVTNAYWAKNLFRARDYCKKLIDAGIGEINISTGMSHQKYVAHQTIVNAAKALTEFRIATLITVETDSESSSCFEKLRSESVIQEELDKESPGIRIQVNSWVRFDKNNEIRQEEQTVSSLSYGCDNLFDTVVVTPDKEIAACCGITMSHIDEMNLGHMSQVENYGKQIDDFLKIWIKTEGAFQILKHIGASKDKLKNINHPCQACAILHKDKEIKKLLVNNYPSHVVRVINKAKLQEITG